MGKTIIIWGLVMVLSLPVFAQRIGIAVLDLEPQGVAASTAAVISEFVRGEFRKSQRMDLVEKNRMDVLLKQRAFEQTGCTESKCAAEAGTILQVDKMIIGTLGKLGQKYVLTLRVVDVKTAKIEYQDREEKIVPEEELDGLVPPLVSRILPNLKLTGLGQALPAEPAPADETGGLKIYTTPSGAKIFIDGNEWGQTPRLVSPLEVGEHSVLLTMEGFRDVVRQVKIAKGITASMNVVLEKVYGSIKVTSSPAGANVYLNGVLKGTTTAQGLSLSGLEIKTYAVKVTHPGYAPYEVDAAIMPDEVIEVNAVLSPKPGSIVITSTPSGAQVSVNGAPKGNTPCSVTNLEPGTYKVTVSKEGYENGEVSVTVGPGESVAKSVVLKKTLTPSVPPSTGGRGTVLGLTYLSTNAQGYKEYRNEKDGSILIEIPAGSFTMGSDDGDSDEKPVHTVHLDKYYIGKYEVTVGQFKKFCQATGRNMPEQPTWNNRDDHPVVNVNWNDAKDYCDWAGLRLPTEAEWEKAARGTDGRKYPWGNTWDASKCNSGEKGDSYEYTSPVGSFPQGVSPYGCYDMAGNVWEWCNDWHDKDYYASSPSSNPAGPSSGDYRVLRGGSWDDDAGNCRSANRWWNNPGSRYNNDGFRVAQ